MLKNVNKVPVLVVLLIVTLVGVSYGQIDKLNQAYDLMKANNGMGARAAIDQAVAHPETQNHPRAWYYRGWIYKNLFTSNPTPEYRLTAIESLLKSISFDSDQKYAEDCKKMGAFLAGSFYNDGGEKYKVKNYKASIADYENYITYTNIFTPGQLDYGAYFVKGICNFYLNDPFKARKDLLVAYKNGYSDPNLYFVLGKSYEAIGKVDSAIAIIREGGRKYPSHNNIMVFQINLYLSAGLTEDAQSVLERAVKTSPTNVDWLLTLGNVYEKKALQDETKKREYIELAKATYKKVIAIEANNFMANFNLGILLYNSAVSLVNNQDYDIDIFALDNVLNESTELFKEALPYVEKATNLQPSDKSALIALEAIYINLRYEDKIDAVQSRLRNMGVGTEPTDKKKKK